MKTLTIQQQQRLYDALRTIAKDFRSSESLMRKPDFGLDSTECLEMAYDNIQDVAKNAIRGIRRPASEANVESEQTTGSNK